MLKWRFFENKAFWHTFAVLCISVFNISAGCIAYFGCQRCQRCHLFFYWMWWLKVVDKDLCLWLKYEEEKRREKPLKEKRYLYYIYNNLYVHVRNSVGTIGTFGTLGTISKKINEFILFFASIVFITPPVHISPVSRGRATFYYLCREITKYNNEQLAMPANFDKSEK